LKGVELAPDFALAHTKLSKHYRRLGALDRAEQHRREAQRLGHPDGAPHTEPVIQMRKGD
jgi:hypothetical protein